MMVAKWETGFSHLFRADAQIVAAEIPISYTANVYSISEITNFISLAGFGLGIGSGRSSGYGRYHVVDVK